MLNTQKFLMISGWSLITLVVLGYIGLGPTAGDSLFGSYFYLDPAESMGHLLLAAICLAGLRLAHTDRWLRIFSGLVGVIALVVVVLGFLNLNTPAPNISLFNLELADSILHLILALAGFWVAFMPEGPMFIRGDQAAKPSVAA
jgi:hypothetical protein